MCRGWAALIGIALAIAAPASAREWMLAVDGDDPLPGGAKLGDWQLDLSLRGDGSVVFGPRGRLLPYAEIFRWSPGAGVERLARFEAETDVDGVPGFDLWGGLESFVDAGERVAVARGGMAGCVEFSAEYAVVGVDDAGFVEMIARPGTAAPGFDAGWFLQGGFGTRGSDAPEIEANRTGRVALIARAQDAELCADDPSTPLADTLFLAESDGSLVRVATDGDPAPDRPGGETIALLGPVQLNDAGDVAFQATIDGGPFGAAKSIYRWNAASGASLVVRETEMFDGVQLFTLDPYFHYALGPSGHVAFVAVDWWSDDPSLWILLSPPGGPLERVIGAGDAAPGMPEGHVFESQGTSNFGGHLVRVNAAGEVAFAARAGAPDVSGDSTEGIWGPDATGALALKLRVGQEIDAIPGEPVASVHLLHLADDRSLLAMVTFDTFFFVPTYLRLDPNGNVEVLGGSQRSIDVAGEPVVLQYGVELRHDPDLRDFAIGAGSQGIYVSVPEPASSASALVAIGALSMFTCRCRNRSCRRVARRLRSAREVDESSHAPA